MLNNCIHTRNIYPFVNSGENLQKFSFLANHMKDCEECKDQYNNLKQSVLDIEELIPEKMISQELQKSFESEMSTVLKKSIHKEKDVDIMNFIPAVIRTQIRDLAATLTSRTMVRAYFFLGIYIVVVKSFTN